MSNQILISVNLFVFHIQSILYFIVILYCPTALSGLTHNVPVRCRCFLFVLFLCQGKIIFRKVINFVYLDLESKYVEYKDFKFFLLHCKCSYSQPLNYKFRGTGGRGCRPFSGFGLALTALVSGNL